MLVIMSLMVSIMASMVALIVASIVDMLPHDPPILFSIAVTVGTLLTFIIMKGVVK
jgi:hypothetical protein